MNIIIDTNTIIGGNYFRSNNFKTLLNYLKKTNSKIVLLQIVKEESIAHYKSDIKKKLNKIGNFSNFCFSTEISIDVNIDNEVIAFSDCIETLKEKKLVYEIAYDNDFLPEIIHRAINRIKPSDINGQEFRDIILWLTILKLLRDQTMFSFSFISNNTKQFASDNELELHSDLASELQSENLKLNYYKSIHDFIKEHADTIDFITPDWIKEELKEIDTKSLITNYIETKLTQKLNLAYVHTYKISVALVDFFVHEGDEDINLFIEYEGKMTLEMGLPNGEIECFNVQIYPQLFSKIVDNKIDDLIVDDCYWIH